MPVTTFSCSPSTHCISGTSSRAATKCISLVPGLAKQVSTPAASSVFTKLIAPFMRSFLASGQVAESFAGHRHRALAKDDSSGGSRWPGNTTKATIHSFPGAMLGHAERQRRCDQAVATHAVQRQKGLLT